MLPSFLVFFEVLGDKYGVRGSRFGHFFGRSKMFQICLGVKISHSGIIKTPPNLHNYIKKLRKNRTSLKMFAIFWALLDPVWDETRFIAMLADRLGVIQPKCREVKSDWKVEKRHVSHSSTGKKCWFTMRNPGISFFNIWRYYGNIVIYSNI